MPSKYDEILSKSLTLGRQQFLRVPQVEGIKPEKLAFAIRNYIKNGKESIAIQASSFKIQVEVMEDGDVALFRGQS